MGKLTGTLTLTLDTVEETNSEYTRIQGLSVYSNEVKDTVAKTVTFDVDTSA